MKNKKGFTLVEIIVVIAIIIVIAGIFSVNMINSLKKNKEEESKNLVSQVVSAADAYVSANPEAIKKLYNGYGYVDIPIGELRDGGVLSEDLKDVETGIRIPDGDLVRVKIETGDVINIIYPISPEDVNAKAWTLEAGDLNIPYDENTSSQEWCSEASNKKNLYAGLDQDNRETPNISMYASGSKLFLVDNDNEGKKYTGNYFDESGVNLNVASCNVNPKVAGTYNITYKFMDPDLKVEKTKSRVVHVKTDNEKDVVKFSVKIEPIDGEEKIVRGWNTKITIEETYKDGKKGTFVAIVTNADAINQLKELGYNIEGYTTETVGEFAPIVSKIKPNSDGSTPSQQKPEYTVVPDTYTLTFDYNKGNVGSETSRIVTYKKEYGTLPNATRTGYSFNGWFTTATGGTKVESTTIMNKLSDHTLYAQWTPLTFTVTFNANSGSVTGSSKKVTYDATYGTLPTPTRTGYSFNGWFTSTTGGNKITSESIVQITSNQTLYAQWKAKKFTVTFNPNGGNVTQKTMEVTYGTTYGALPTPSRSSYSFKGWYTTTSGGTKITSGSTVNITSNTVLYANWSYNPPYTPPSSSYYPPSYPSVTPSTHTTTTGGSSKPVTSTCDATCKMKKNSDKWWDIQNDTSLTADQKKTEQGKLSEDQAKLAKEVEDQLGQSLSLNGDGTWSVGNSKDPYYLTDKQKENANKNNNSGGSSSGGSSSGSSGSSKPSSSNYAAQQAAQAAAARRAQSSANRYSSRYAKY